MAKEMMIVFVYDTQACTSEEDDPADAVLYFHPGWVSDQQRHALAGQVVGTAHCVKSLFSQPLAITLQSGKFIIREYGRLILAIGSDRNIPDWVLNNRAQLLTSLIRVHHGDLTAVGRADKLYQMFETYLPMLQYGRHIFQRVPMLNLPKSETSVYLEAMQVLEYCRRNKGVLGGVILYNNKIVATQLPPGLTSYLTVVDPYRIKSPAEVLATATPLPLGSQLLAVYVQPSTYENLKRAASTVQAFVDDGEDTIARFRKHQEAEREKQREFPATGMKRDKSLLFTAVPEEDHSMISPPTHADNRTESDRKHPNIPDVVPFTNRPRPRPNKLSLSFKTQQSLDEDVKEEKVFTGQTSVCSTPMVENKRLHGNVISICQNTDQKADTEPDVLRNTEEKIDVIAQEKKDTKLSLQFNCIGDHYINKPGPIRKLNSVMDIQESIKRISNRAISKFKARGAKARDDISPSPEPSIKKAISTMTINDPSFPVFRDDGKEISESLYKQYLEQHYAEMKRDLSNEDNLFTFSKKLEQSQFDGFDSELSKSPQRTPKKIPKETIKSDQSRRKSLSLPLKSLSESSDSQVGSESDAATFKKKLSGVQLTPLMEKLSHLAFSDKSSGYSSRVMTPLELRDFSTPAAEKHINFSEKSKRRPETTEDECDVPLELLPSYSAHAVKCALFVTGIQNMALLALVDIDAIDDADTINSLWETSLNCLGSIEEKCMEPFPTTETVDYSYLTLDPDWGTVKTGGRWASLDIATMGLIHTEFADDPQLEEMILRSDDSVVLGATCGGAQVYYQEGGTRQAGVPAPSDPLASAALRAKRRLQRDHGVLIL